MAASTRRATSSDGLSEKTVVLAVAQRLKDRLSQGGRYDVYMTRTRDVFISLDGRVRRSRKLAADLFISLHADSIAQNADTVRGATVYTLSERASDKEARLMAEKENNSDHRGAYRPCASSGRGRCATS